MFKVWALIIFGVIVFPIISEMAKKYEERANADDKDKEKYEKKAKLMKYSVWGLFVLIALLVAYFAATLIPQ